MRSTTRIKIVDTEIEAPVKWRHRQQNVVGEWVTWASGYTIDDLSTIWARVDVEETDLGALYIGKSAQIELPTTPPHFHRSRDGDWREEPVCDPEARRASLRTSELSTSKSRCCRPRANSNPG